MKKKVEIMIKQQKQYVIYEGMKRKESLYIGRYTILAVKIESSKNKD